MTKKLTGYSLIEIIVVIAVGAVLAGIGLFNLNVLNRRQALVQNTKKIVTEIRLAKSLTDSQQKPEGCATLNGYRFSIVGTTQTTIEGVCDNATYSYQSKTTTAGLSGMTSVFFPVLQQPAIFTGPPGAQNQIVVTQNNQTIIISIGITGVVEYD